MITAFIVGLAHLRTGALGLCCGLGLLLVAVAAAGLFIVVERRQAQPLVDLHLLGRSPSYRTAVISEGVAGYAEMGLGVILRPARRRPGPSPGVSATAEQFGGH